MRQKINGDVFCFAYSQGRTQKTHPQYQLPDKNIPPQNSLIKNVTHNDLTESKQDHQGKQNGDGQRFHFPQKVFDLVEEPHESFLKKVGPAEGRKRTGKWIGPNDPENFS